MNNPKYIATARLYLTADKETVVDESDERAAWLLAGVGGSVPYAQAVKLGLIDAQEIPVTVGDAPPQETGVAPTTGNEIVDALNRLPEEALDTIAQEKHVELPEGASRAVKTDAILLASGYNFDHTGKMQQTSDETSDADSDQAKGAKAQSSPDQTKAIRSAPETK